MSDTQNNFFFIQFLLSDNSNVIMSTTAPMSQYSYSGRLDDILNNASIKLITAHAMNVVIPQRAKINRTQEIIAKNVIQNFSCHFIKFPYLSNM